MLEQRDLERLQGMFARSENLILSELDRTRGILEKQISRVEDDVRELKEYYRIHRLESESALALHGAYDKLNSRVKALEARLA